MTRIVVLGAGFGGMQAVIELERAFRAAPDVEILLISDQNHLLFTPLLPQIPSSYIDPRHIAQPVRDIRRSRRFRFRRDRVQRIDVERRRIECAEGDVEYDTLIVALGSRTDYFNVPGARENTWDFKTLEDAVVLRERILDLCEHADHTEGAAARRHMLTFVIIGGGYTGVELVTEMHDFFRLYVVKHFRGLTKSDVRLLVLEAAPEVLRGVHPKLAANAQRRLAREGIETRVNARVTKCEPGAVEVNGAERIEADTIIWAGGVRARELVESLPGPHDRIGRAIVNEHLQLEGHPEVFVVGDSSAAVTAPDAPRVAPVAIDHGRIAGRNIAHLARREPLESYRFVEKGVLVSLGMNHAVVNIGGIRLSGYLAWLLWNAVHLYKQVGFKKQVQVTIDWSLGTIFPRDAIILRRPRRCPLCGTDF